nr:hypothetical protein [Novosphingobium sp.]
MKAYGAASLGPEDVDVAEVHDATAVGEVIQVENLGLVPRGLGGEAALQGQTCLGGRIPVNPSGGLESKGHPIGATGLAQIFELVTQLRGEPGSARSTTRLSRSRRTAAGFGALKRPSAQSAFFRASPSGFDHAIRTGAHQR